MLRTLLAVSLLFTLSAASAQIAFGGTALGLRSRGVILPAAPVVELPMVDAEVLMAEDEARAAAGIKGPFRFGANHSTDITLENAGVWHTMRGGDRVWRVALLCPGAFTINFKFTEYVMPVGAKLFVYNEAGQQLGAFTAASNPGHQRLGVTQLPGDRITIEYHEPFAASGEGRLRIGQVTHGYRDLFKIARDLGDSESCNINVICPEGDDWRDEIRTVAIITAGGNGFCTGTLLNNCALDSTPYFLTANHCLDPDVEDWVFRFNWDSPVCDPTENGPIDQTVSGCELLVSNVGTDMAFLLLNTPPPAEYNVNWAGWDKRDIAATSAVGIHHPSGDIKKISRTDGALSQADIDLGTGNADCWRVAVWDAGTTEPGSSGSALWDQNHRVVGQLYGGSADCANSVDDYYGRFSTSWPFLEEWLGTCGDTLDGLNIPSVVPMNWDAAVTSIYNVPELVCNSDVITPFITIKNNGLMPLTSVALSYGVPGQPQANTFWTGSLQPGETVNHQLPAIFVGAGEHVLTVSSSAPNGNEDQFMENDSWTFEFVANSPGQEVLFGLVLDDYGTDITWTLQTDSGTVIYEGGPYADGQDGDLVSVPFCLTNGCYTFTINDALADGICCDAGEGSYSIGIEGWVTFAESDGQYGEGEVQRFCLAEVAVAEVEGRGSLRLVPNPSNGGVRLDLIGQEGALLLEVMDASGRSLLAQMLAAGTRTTWLDLGTWADGVYLVSVRNADGRSVQRLVLQH